MEENNLRLDNSTSFISLRTALANRDWPTIRSAGEEVLQMLDGVAPSDLIASLHYFVAELSDDGAQSLEMALADYRAAHAAYLATQSRLNKATAAYHVGRVLL